MTRKLSDGDIEIVSSYDAQVATGDDTFAAGVAVDLSDCEDAIIQVDLGAHGDAGAGVGIEVGLRSGSDTVVATHTDVADADLSETIAGTATISAAQDSGIICRAEDDSDSRIITTEYKGIDQYVSAYVLFDDDNANGIPVSVNVIKSRLKAAPSTVNNS